MLLDYLGCYALIDNEWRGGSVSNSRLLPFSRLRAQTWSTFFVQTSMVDIRMHIAWYPARAVQYKDNGELYKGWKHALQCTEKCPQNRCQAVWFGMTQ